jgi:HEXXH motif-containing protein
MTDIDHENRGFSSPHEPQPLDRGYLASITRRRSARIAELFLKCFRRRLSEHDAGLVATVERFRDEPGDFTTSWSSAIGQMRLALLTRPHDIDQAIAAATSLARHLDSAHRLLTFESSMTPWSPLPDGFVASTSHDASVVAKYEAAYALIARYADMYTAWIERGIRTLVPVEAPPGKMISSSFEHLPTVVAISHASPAITLAEMLVHEASHQHFFMLTQLGPVDDGTDTELYYSPLRSTHRPIDRILFAYHAMANVLLFYRSCRRRGFVDVDFCRSQEQSTEEWVTELRRPLQTTRALTPLGRALFEPLAERVERDRQQDLVVERPQILAALA